MGSSFALLALMASILTGNPLYDALDSTCIGALLIIVAVLVGREVKDLLIGQGVGKVVKREMLEFLALQPEAETIYNLISLQLGADAMVAVKAQMAPAGSGEYDQSGGKRISSGIPRSCLAIFRAGQNGKDDGITGKTMAKLIRLLVAVLIAGIILLGVLYFFSTVIDQENSRIRVIPLDTGGRNSEY